jgi:hypothetical protein
MVYVEAGDQRLSSAGTVDHFFDLQVGGGVQVKLSDRFAPQFVPAENDLRHQAAGRRIGTPRMRESRGPFGNKEITDNTEKT